jgi:hypothetical protein
MTPEPSAQRSLSELAERSSSFARPLRASRTLAVSVKQIGWSVCVFNRNPARLWILPVVPLGLRLGPLDDKSVDRRFPPASTRLSTKFRNNWMATLRCRRSFGVWFKTKELKTEIRGGVDQEPTSTIGTDRNATLRSLFNQSSAGSSTLPARTVPLRNSAAGCRA